LIPCSVRERSVVLRGGPLDGHLHAVDARQGVAYIVYQTRSADDLARLGLSTVDGAVRPVLLVYRQSERDSPVWQFIGLSEYR